MNIQHIKRTNGILKKAIMDFGKFYIGIINGFMYLFFAFASICSITLLAMLYPEIFTLFIQIVKPVIIILGKIMIIIGYLLIILLMSYIFFNIANYLMKFIEKDKLRMKNKQKELIKEIIKELNKGKKK